MRDGISLLEQCASYNQDLNLDNVIAVLGSYSYNLFFELINCCIDGKLDEIIKIVNQIYNDGNDLKLFVDQFLSFILNVSKYIICQNIDVTNFPVNQEQSIKSVINFEDPLNYYQYVIDKLMELKVSIKNDTDIKSTIEVYFIQIGRCK